MNARPGQAGRKPHHNRLLLTFAYRSHARTLAVPRFAAFVVFLLIPLAAVIYLAATYYFIFHDDVLARLMQHQADMQYAYEDRITALQRDVANAKQRADIDAADFVTRLHVLSQRQDQVESRTALIAAFADHEKQMQLPPVETHGAGPADVDTTPTSAFAPAPAGVSPAVAGDGKPHPAGFDLRLEDGAQAPPLPFSSSEAAPDEEAPMPSPDLTASALKARYERADAEDLALLKALERPADRLTRDVRDTLAAVGLSPSRFHLRPSPARSAADGIGGPFVPLPILSDGSPFASAAARLQDSLASAEDLREVLPHVPLKAPLPGDLEVTSPFGPRIDPFLGRPALHTGVDLRGAYGDAVRATAPGRVSFAGTMGGYGNLVEIDNGNGLSTRYAHLSSIDVGVGETVTTGTVVGHIGDTGRATGPHLHYEVRIDGQPVDPERFLRVGFALGSVPAH
jgi:murein DD-endopeptidase MepM/ murein hydrolase activator NlpD